VCSKNWDKKQEGNKKQASNVTTCADHPLRGLVTAAPYVSGLAVCNNSAGIEG